MIGDVCTADWLHDRLQVTSSSTSGLDDVAAGGLLVLDCRSVDEYAACHVTGSMPVTVPSIMLRRLRNGSASVASVIGGGDALRAAFVERWKSDCIVLYDNDASAHLPGPGLEAGVDCCSILTTLMKRLKADGCRVYCLQGGFTSFRDKYSHMCIAGTHQHHHVPHQHAKQLHCRNPHLLLSDAFSNMRLSSSAPSSLSSLNLFIAASTDADSCAAEGSSNGHCSSSSACSSMTPTPVAPPSGGGLPFPVEVVQQLYLGDAETSRDLDCLRRHNIRYIVNVTENVANSFGDDPTFTYMRIPITDHWSQSLTSFFATAIVFIDDARQSDSAVLVHCLAGISRSVTVTVAYLMYFMSLTLDDAFDYLRRIRPNIAPNFSFMGQLLDFEKTLQLARSRCRCTDAVHSPCRHCFHDVTSTSSEQTNDVTIPIVALALP